MGLGSKCDKLIIEKKGKTKKSNKVPCRRRRPVHQVSTVVGSSLVQPVSGRQRRHFERVETKTDRERRRRTDVRGRGEDGQRDVGHYQMPNREKTTEQRPDGGEEAEARRETAERRPDGGEDGQSDGDATMQSSDGERERRPAEGRQPSERRMGRRRGRAGGWSERRNPGLICLWLGLSGVSAVWIHKTQH